MIGLGTIINTFAVAVAGLLGRLFGRFLTPRHQDTVMMVSGVSVLFLAIAGVMEHMLSIVEGGLVSGESLLLVSCLTLGALVGETVNLEDGFTNFGEWLKKKTGHSKDGGFVDAFVTASLTVSIGAMAIVGSIQDGIQGDTSILVTKSILDFIIVFVMSSSMGSGCIFSAIPIFVLEGSMTLLARLISPLLTDLALHNISLVGNVLIFCVGMNLVFGKKVRVANLLPSLIFAVAAAFLPINWM